MTATVDEAPNGRAGRGPGPGAGSPRTERPLPTPPPAPTVSTRRRPALLALGVALTATGALTSAWLVAHADTRTSVVAVARDVPYGAVVASGDLVLTDVALDAGVRTVPADQVRSLVGQVAAVPLLAGTLLSPGSVSDLAPPLRGQVLVALAVPGARMPTRSLSAGDRVLVVNTPVRDADAPTSPPATLAATVVGIGATDLEDLTVVDLAVADSDGPMAAAWSATGRVALVLQPRGNE